jgi:predicted transcriptional regulator
MPENGSRRNGRRRSVLDLAPLERDCMQALWPLREGTVREIREQMAGSRPRAYTTIMTIMDRLAQKGVVTRSKAGRAWLYRPNFTAEEARAHAVAQLVAHFFDGSREALRAHLGGEEIPIPPGAERPAAPPREQPRVARRTRAVREERAQPVSPRLDDTLL